jgi:hypothetical protein
MTLSVIAKYTNEKAKIGGVDYKTWTQNEVSIRNSVKTYS